MEHDLLGDAERTYTITVESDQALEEVMRLPHYGDRSKEYFVNRAITKYRDRKVAEDKAREWRYKNIGKRIRMQGHKCYFCPTMLSRQNATVDHLTPIVRGGAIDDPNNYAIVCYPCNQRKSDMTEAEFRDFIGALESKHANNS